ncbi:hypothetical protein DMH02_024735 [Streptomyces sp. WAC 00631]|uniref:hypothetical protein n=1 Tax=Streptomyces sp. WAC 00631 TaxID=2203201 RepID=UPI000F798E19|nr:hypothetical protein [Streptomyces sp. WAC 00631]MCC5036304.1 hypothetical protein [Streptomyces sp. WAC 00631]
MITASDPWQGHDSTVLFPLLIGGAATLVAITVYLCSRLTRQARLRFTPSRTFRDVSLAAVAAGIALYLWGCLHVLFLEDQEQAEECERRRPEGVPALVGRRGDFIPLRLVCESSNGRDYSVIIPDYVNPSIAVLMVLALLSAAASGIFRRKRLTTQRRKG